MPTITTKTYQMLVGTDPVPCPPDRPAVRIGLIIQNVDPTNDVFVGGSDVTITTGIRLVARTGHLELSHQFNDPDWFIVAASTDVEVRVAEISAREVKY